jgi:ATP-binding cassette, subfamily B, bacterial
MITDPRILVLDEATSSIDVATEARVQRGLARLLAGRTSLVIAHRLSTIRGADHVVVLEAGRVVEQGSPADLRTAGGHYAQLEAESDRLA